MTRKNKRSKEKRYRHEVNLNATSAYGLGLRRLLLLKLAGKVFFCVLLFCLFAVLFFYFAKWFYFGYLDFRLKNLKINAPNAWIANRTAEKCALQKNMSMWKINLQNLRRKLLLEPDIKEVIVERKFPSSLNIFLEARRPLARLDLEIINQTINEQNFFLIDEECFLWRANNLFESHFKLQKLPVVKLYELEKVENAKKLPSKNALCAINFIKEFSALKTANGMEILKNWQLEKLNMVNNFSFFADFLVFNDLITEKKTSKKIRILFSKQKISRQFKKMAFIAQKIQRNGHFPEEINLSVENQIFITGGKFIEFNEKLKNDYVENNQKEKNLNKQKKIKAFPTVDDILVGRKIGTF